jgi:hypothetical protein
VKPRQPAASRLVRRRPEGSFGRNEHTCCRDSPQQLRKNLLSYQSRRQFRGDQTGSLVARPAPDRSIRFVAVIEPPVASMRPRVISRGSIYCLARPAGAANSCRQRSGSRRHARLVEAGAAALSLHRAHFCRRRIPAPKMAKASAATSRTRATSQGGATRPARAIAASVALRMPSNRSRLKWWTPGGRAACGGDGASCEAGDDFVGAAPEGTILKIGAIMASSGSAVARAREARATSQRVVRCLLRSHGLPGRRASSTVTADHKCLLSLSEDWLVDRGFMFPSVGCGVRHCRERHGMFDTTTGPSDIPLKREESSPISRFR